MDTYVYGQRAIWLHSSTDAVGAHPERPPNTIELVDFSLAVCNSSTLVPSSTIQLGQTPIFEDVVETHLPCVSTEWNLKQAYPLYMIYEDGIIGVDRKEDDTRSLHILEIAASQVVSDNSTPVRVSCIPANLWTCYRAIYLNWPLAIDKPVFLDRTTSAANPRPIAEK
ncbi:hypothetical protein BJ912DRAFT_919158 [Pholiota molesta]|nr:hypothetical protein BJ912DRAFT_919158 [Pholiota molesta]